MKSDSNCAIPLGIVQWFESPHEQHLHPYAAFALFVHVCPVFFFSHTFIPDCEDCRSFGYGDVHRKSNSSHSFCWEQWHRS